MTFRITLKRSIVKNLSGKDCMYVELVDYKVSNRNKIVLLSELSTDSVPHERYISVFPYGRDISQYVKTTGSVAEYKGKRYAPCIYMDFDSANEIYEAQEEVRDLISGLVKDYSVQIKDIDVFFSGSKGFHVVLYEKTLGGIEMSEDIPDKVKRFVLKLKQKYRLNHLDESIYSRTSIIRTPNSVNSKTGLYKIPIKHDEIALHISDIKKLAQQPRMISRDRNSYSMLKNEGLSNLFHGYTDVKDISIVASGVSSNFFEGTEQGDRNNRLFKQACMLFDKSQMDLETITRFVKLINTQNDPPLPDREVNLIIESASKKTIKNRKTPSETGITIKPVSEWADEWYESILPENNKISLLLPKYDREFEGKVRGKLCVLLGYAGSKKSMYGQNLAYHNVVNLGLRGIYSTMEASAQDTVGRFINMVKGDAGYTKNPEKDIAEKEQQETGYALKEFNDVAKKLSDKLQITQDPSCESAHYDKMIHQVTENSGQVDFLIVDGLSMMGGNEDSTRRAERHTKELKELAKKWNIFIVLIVHVKRGDTETTRDLSRSARDSEKIVDNCDFYISFSKIEVNTPYGNVYSKDKGNMRLHNKRGSGNTIDVVFYLNPISLRMSDTGETVEKVTDNF